MQDECSESGFLNDTGRHNKTCKILAKPIQHSDTNFKLISSVFSKDNYIIIIIRCHHDTSCHHMKSSLKVCKASLLFSNR